MTTKTANYYFSTPEEAETAFHSAFEMGDLQLMTAVMANEEGLCVHPGGLPIMGRDKILQSWQAVLSSEKLPTVHVDVISTAHADDFSVHHVVERLAASHQIDAPVSLVLSTNIYLNTYLTQLTLQKALH